jgi:proteic killer suppression protein
MIFGLKTKLNEPVKGKPLYNKEVVKKFQERILLMELVESTKGLREFKSLHFEALQGDKKGLFSIRINKQYRLEFSIENDSIQVEEIILIEE